MERGVDTVRADRLSLRAPDYLERCTDEYIRAHQIVTEIANLVALARANALEWPVAMTIALELSNEAT